MRIPQVLDPADMVQEPDEHANMTYISYFRDYLARARTAEEEERLRRGNFLAFSRFLSSSPFLTGFD